MPANSKLGKKKLDVTYNGHGVGLEIHLRDIAIIMGSLPKYEFLFVKAGGGGTPLFGLYGEVPLDRV